MPPDRGRASKACIACRKQKTRCYDTADSQTCLRCERLGKQCSFGSPEDSSLELHSPAQLEGTSNPTNASQSTRFQHLERCIETLLKRVEVLESGRADLPSGQPKEQEVCQHHNEHESTERDPAPLFVLRAAITESGLHTAEGTATSGSSRGLSDDVIHKGLITSQEAYSFISLFQEHYGRWVLFRPLTPTVVLLEEVRKSPLLLAACCLIAVRHTTQDLASRLAPVLFKEAKTLLSVAMLNTPQPIEFFQTALILSMWSTTIGQIPLSIDSWLLSGFALQHSVASGLFNPALDHSSGLHKPALDYLCIWNHLCLVHLHYCVGTRRRAVIDRKDISRCRLILGSDYASNFESRMVAEVFLYWVIYESCSAPVDLPKDQSVLQAWNEEWQFLFEQPRSQFVQMGFYFAQLLIYDRSLKTRSSAAQQSLLGEMVRLSTALIRVAMENTDDRIMHLTDHIYHMVGFAAVKLTRLLHDHEQQISLSHDIGALDQLVLSLVPWLHAIGLPCHVAHTMGNIVAASHQRFRLDSSSSANILHAEFDITVEDNYAQLFPELFGTSSHVVENEPMQPDLQPVPWPRSL